MFYKKTLFQSFHLETSALIQCYLPFVINCEILPISEQKLFLRQTFSRKARMGVLRTSMNNGLNVQNSVSF